ncbi:uncharacterized protein A4U43_C09F2460 [Asparagus officinalis]|uniref:DUF632 domain-containing protein n=2 Tax=Asparagus officinalis TaxID=4686 RepID=A0A5P1E587_ASPOF|nr:uncharacterized protein A4U43_C09F2460 [Asparagus officinalis]
MDFGEGTSRSVPEEDIEKSIDSEHEKESISISGGSKESSIKENEGQAKDEGVTLEEESRASNVNLAAANGNRDIMEVVIEIKKLFQSAADCGEEVSRMLEVGKLNYRSRSRISRVVSSRIWEPMGLSILSTRPFKHSQSSATRPTKNRNNPAVSENRIGIKPGNLSSTLEKLYVWEKKLYKEVKDEEKLRRIYEKKWRRLRRLDNRGAESNKIDSTRASIKQLQLKLSIVIRSVDTISSRIHKIRDDELQPQLVELIKRLIRMWKSMLECHRKQLQAILDSKTHNLRAKTGVHGHIVANATKELEIQLVNWCSCFYNWISIQKSYVEALNGWLMKWLPQEEEETEDGILPFSPSRIKAPVVFVVSNDWSNALLRVSESEVMTAMHNFAVHVHNLWESQDEEQRLKLKAEFLSRDYDQRLNTLKRDGRIQGNNLDVVSATNAGQVYQDDTRKALELARKRLEEERTKHRQIAKQVQEAASSTLETGLLPVFEALRGFISETVDAYKELRIPKEGDGGP